MPTRRAVLMLLTALAGPPACATGNLVDMRLLDRSQGQALDTWRYRDAAWVAGQPGNRYAVQLTNRTDARVLVVLSIDGINAISGETAAVGQTGYVLAPHATAEITGWRKSLSEAAAFYFTSLPDSYAARTDRPENVGVIGAAVYRERVWRPEPRPSYSPAPYSQREPAPMAQRDAAPSGESAPRSEAAAAGSSDSVARAAPEALGKAAEKRLGTGHGEREYSPTSQVAFERATSQPAEIVKVRYDSYQNLVAMGVIESRREPYGPDPFPRFAPDPR